MTTPTKKTASDAHVPSASASSAGAASSEQPQRSRNARAQARHRAKRKAYIEQLEETVTKLQAALNLTPEQVAAMPPAQLRIRELEAENHRLRRELDEARVQLDAYARGHGQGGYSHGHGHGGHGHVGGGGGHAHGHTHPGCCSGGGGGGRHETNASPVDNMNMGGVDRDKRRTGRRNSEEMEVYLTPGGTPPTAMGHAHGQRLPPLSLPTSNHPQYQISPHGHGLGSLTHGNGTSSSAGTTTSTPSLMVHSPVFGVPSTPGGSSSSSTPSYPTPNNLPPEDHIRKPNRANSLDSSEAGGAPRGLPGVGVQLPPPVPGQYHNGLASYPHHPNFEMVKSEDEHYSQHHLPNNVTSGGGVPALNTYGSGQESANSWVYSTGRVHASQHSYTTNRP